MKKLTEPEMYNVEYKYQELKTPFTCPVCSGNGKVQNGFYNTVTGLVSTTDATLEQCRSCNGTGIVWG